MLGGNCEALSLPGSRQSGRSEHMRKHQLLCRMQKLYHASRHNGRLSTFEATVYY